MATIQYAAPVPEKAHVLHVGLLIDGIIRETPVRKEKFLSLGPDKAPFTAGQLAYALECADFHHPNVRGKDAQRVARRKEWDADDKAKADAAAEAARLAAEAEAEAARQAELARFIVAPTGWAKDKDGNAVGVIATITHQGHTCTANIGLVPELAEQNARAAWTESKAKADAEAALLQSFAISQ